MRPIAVACPRGGRLHLASRIWCQPHSQNTHIALAPPSSTWGIQRGMSEQPPPACPRWQEIIREAVREGPPGVGHYSLATAVYDSATQRITPFNRTVGHRCFLNEPVENVGSEGQEYVDERFGSTSTMLFTTDARSQKVREAMQSSGAAIVWYFPNKQLQARLTGSLYVLAHPDHPSVDLFPATELKPPNSTRDESIAFDWQRVRLGLFKCLSPSLFAALYRPEPGSAHPHNEELVAADSWPGKPEDALLGEEERPWEVHVDRRELEKRLAQGELKSLVEAAERNFAVMLFRPDSVDLVDLATDRRSRSVRTGRDEWVEQRTVP